MIPSILFADMELNMSMLAFFLAKISYNAIFHFTEITVVCSENRKTKKQLVEKNR